MSSDDSDDKILDAMHIVNSPQHCPHCNKVMQGPITKFVKRQDDLYFDIEKKYEYCEFCKARVEIVDFQVLYEKLSSKLPPEQARQFSIKTQKLFEIMPENTVELFSAISEEGQQDIMMPIDNLVCMESLNCNYDKDDCHCSKCMFKTLTPNGKIESNRS